MKKRNYIISLSLVVLFLSINESYSALEGEWQYNEGGIPLMTYDQTSNNNDLTLGSIVGGDPSDPEFSTDKPIDGYSMSFDGINDYLWRTNTSSLSPSNDYTLATWVKLSTLALGDQDILISNIGAYNASGGYQLAFYMSAGNPHLGTMYRPNTGGSYPDTGVGISLSSLAYEADTWYHVASTFDSSGGNTTVKLFLDGKKVTEGTYSGVTSYNNTPYFFVGTNYDGDGNTGLSERELNGKMDETRVYSHDLSETSVRTLAEIDITWKAAVSDLTSNKARWQIPKIPTYSTNVILPDYGTSYTVTLDGDAEINDLEVGENVIAYLGNYTLTVEDGADIDGTLELAGAHYAGDGTMSTGSNSLVKGYGTIDQSFSNNTGTIKAQNGQLSIELSANNSEGVLSADTGATLLIRNNSDLTNKDQIILNGGTLKSPSTIYNLINYSSGDSISGYGIIDNYYVNIDEGSLTAQGNNKTLTLNEGFSSNQSSGTINILSGATLNVLQNWTNYATINMSGGSITGSTMAQNNGSTGLLVSAGNNNIQNVTFASGSKNIISNNSTLTITGTATLSNASITESGLGGNFNIGNNAIVQGYGTINPDMVADGNLIANSANNQLNVNGALQINSNRSVYATSFGISNLNGSVTNFGNIYSNSSTVNINGSLTNSGDVYSNSGSFVNINGSLTNSGEVYSNGGTLILNGQIYNRSDIYVDSGSMIIEGTIKEGIQETGNFKATNGLMEINGPVEQNARNTFTSSNGGTILFDWSFATQDLWQTNPLIAEGGTINLKEGETLTNSTGKQISGYGTLLGENRNLVNEGTILASAGTLNVHGNIQNSGIMRAEGENNSLVIGSTLQVNEGGSVSALDAGDVTIMSDLINNGRISVDGNSSALHVLDTTPQGLGEFIADGGSMYFSNGFSNSGLQKENALVLAGGRMTIKKGTMTNAENKVISGYGSLLDSDTGGGLVEKNLMNHGSIIASGGDIYIYGKEISNKGLIYADSPDNIIMQSESFINEEDGLVKAENGADITINNSSNNGTIACAGTSHVIFNGDATGEGIYSLDFGRMEFRNSLIMDDKTIIDDRNVDGSGITVYGNLTKTQGSLDAFNADQIDMNIFSPKMTVATPHLLTWEAIDEGVSYLGLLDNLAIGHLIFGDDFGVESSDLFELMGDSIIYCYGLSILTDAELDLGGNTIYYLREDDVFNDILGTGFENYGSYHNGDIVEITAPIPEPCAMLLFLFIGLPFIYRSRKVL